MPGEAGGRSGHRCHHELAWDKVLQLLARAWCLWQPSLLISSCCDLVILCQESKLRFRLMGGSLNHPNADIWAGPPSTFHSFIFKSVFGSQGWLQKPNKSQLTIWNSFSNKVLMHANSTASWAKVCFSTNYELFRQCCNQNIAIWLNFPQAGQKTSAIIFRTLIRYSFNFL